MATDPEQSSREPSLDEAIVEGVLFGEFSSQDDNWSSLGAEDAALARGALRRAQELRDAHADPGDAYLAAVAELSVVQSRRVDVTKALAELAQLPELDAAG